MRTNIVIDEKLMAQALKVSGARSKREAVELGLKTLLQLRKQSEARRLRGAVKWEGDLEAMRADKLDSLLGVVPLAVGDLISTEVLQGCPTEREFNAVRRVLESLSLVILDGPDVAVAAARNFRWPRALGVTVRKTIDTVIATVPFSATSTAC